MGCTEELHEQAVAKWDPSGPAEATPFIDMFEPNALNVIRSVWATVVSRGVLQHQLGQFGRGSCAVDFALEPFLVQAGDQAAMVDMCVGEQDKVEFAGLKGELRRIPTLRVALALIHAAVNKELKVGAILSGAPP